jgi:peptide deformylase
MIKQLVTDPKELKVKCVPVLPGEDISQIIQDLEDTFETLKKYGQGLAANQIGYHKQVAIIRTPTCQVTLINPVILSKDRKITFNEGCLSFPGLAILTDRYSEVIVESGAEEEKQRYSVTGIEAVVVLHETDHLNGITFLERKHRKRK